MFYTVFLCIIVKYCYWGGVNPLSSFTRQNYVHKKLHIKEKHTYFVKLKAINL